MGRYAEDELWYPGDRAQDVLDRPDPAERGLDAPARPASFGSRQLANRDPYWIARTPSGLATNVTNAIGRRRVYDLEPRSQARLDGERLPPMSAPIVIAQRSPRVIASPAKASAADRRKFGAASARTLFGTSPWMKVLNSGKLVFTNPNVVVPCVQRKARREVLFAKKKHGAHFTKRRRTWTSSVHC